jgi:uncharacterized membrane protein YsdA (DUF1294 family)
MNIFFSTVFFSFLVVAVLTIGFWYWYEFGLFLSYFLSISAVTILLYFLDKLSSRMKGRYPRIPERTLHILALFGGSFAALIAQQFFRHKTRKTKFLVLYYLIVALQAFLAYWVYFRLS